MPHPDETEISPTRQVGGARVSLLQAVEHQQDDFTRRYIVVEFSEDGVILDDLDFNGVRFEVTPPEWDEYRPLTAVDGTPVFGW